MNKNIFVSLLAVAVVGGGAFFGGMKYQESKNASAFPASRNFQGMPGAAAGNSGARANRNGGGGMVVGEITAVDGDSVTVKSADGASKIVFFSEKTSIGNFTAAQSGDLAVGQSVTAAGTAGTDGSIVANNIQIGAPARSAGTLPAAPADENQEDPSIQPVM